MSSTPAANGIRVQTGDVANAGGTLTNFFAGFLGGDTRIVEFIDPNDQSVTNITLSTHIFADGVVYLSPYYTNTGVAVEVLGLGNGNTVAGLNSNLMVMSGLWGGRDAILSGVMGGNAERIRNILSPSPDSYIGLVVVQDRDGGVMLLQDDRSPSLFLKDKFQLNGVKPSPTYIEDAPVDSGFARYAANNSISATDDGYRGLYPSLSPTAAYDPRQGVTIVPAELQPLQLILTALPNPSYSFNPGTGPAGWNESFPVDAAGDLQFDPPIVLDLTGTGIAITQLSSSNRYMDTNGSGLKHRTAWAAAGNGVLVITKDGATTADQLTARDFEFTLWDPTAKTDIEAHSAWSPAAAARAAGSRAPSDVFDTSHDRVLSAADADWQYFKVLVTNADGTMTLRTLAELGAGRCASGATAPHPVRGVTPRAPLFLIWSSDVDGPSCEAPRPKKREVWRDTSPQRGAGPAPLAAPAANDNALTWQEIAA